MTNSHGSFFKAESKTEKSNEDSSTFTEIRNALWCYLQACKIPRYKVLNECNDPLQFKQIIKHKILPFKENESVQLNEFSLTATLMLTLLAYETAPQEIKRVTICVSDRLTELSNLKDQASWIEYFEFNFLQAAMCFLKLEFTPSPSLFGLS